MKNGLEGREATCTGEKGMTYIIIHVIWLVIKVVLAYDFTCPHPGQWNLIAETKNCSRKDYVCLLDDVKLKDTEACKSEGPRIENNGFKAVLNNGNLNAIACSSTRFQPLQFSSFKDSRCVLEKSLCSEEGQVLADTGTAEIDRSCRCDYVKGYAILANTSNLCSCTPSEEDCTCFKKSCSDTEILSPDYKCIKETELQGIHQCTSISDRESIEPAIDVVSVNAPVPKGYNKVYRYAAAICCTIILVIIIVLSICVIFCWKQTKRKIWHVWTYLRNCCRKIIIVKQLEKQSCDEGDSVTFTCEVNQNDIPAKWSKDGKELSESIDITAVGNIHKIVIHSVTANDSGNYSCHIKDKNSSAQLTVKEVTFIKKFKDQKCFEGETVTFTCEVSHENVTGKWIKDGTKLKPSKSIKITVNGRIHNLIIQRVTVKDRGRYIFKVADKAYGANLILEDTKYIKLYHLLKTVVEPVVRKLFDHEIHPNQLKKTLIKGKNKIDWLKKQRYINWREYDLLYPKVVEYSVKFKIMNHDYSQIQGNEEEDKRIRAEIQHDVSALFNSVQGVHKIVVLNLESGSLIAVIKLIASQIFEKTLKSTIVSAVKEGKIGLFETDSDEFIFEKLANVQVPITSKNFDIRLMIILMKNLIEAYVKIDDVLPHETDVSEVADLSRIRYIRNKIVQNSDKSISDEDYEEDWSNLSQALKRLGGESVAEECKILREYQPTYQQCKDYLNSETFQCDQESTSTDSLTRGFFKEANMHNLARDVVRRRFDKQFPPQTLEKEIEKLREHLTKMKEQRGITQSQWDDLFPEDKGSLSSTRFDMKVMIILLSNSPFKDEEIFKTIENLQNYLSRPKEEKKAIMQAIKEISEGE